MGCRRNAPVLNHRWVVGLARDSLCPLASGRSLPIFVLARFTPSNGFTGNPDRQVTMEPSCHPHTMASRNLFWISILRPFPKGRSYRPDITRRWRTSKADRPRSQRWHAPFCEKRESLSSVQIPLLSSIALDHISATNPAKPLAHSLLNFAPIQLHS